MLQGSAANQGTLNVAAPAGFGTAGVVTGQVDLLNDAAVIFASGQLTSIAAGSELTLDGANARVANSSNTSTNSALTGLTTISGSFDLRNGATASVSGSLDIGAGGALVLDRFGGSGGAHLTVAGTLTNSNLLIGNTGLSAADDVTADGLVNTGRILVQGSAANQATLNVAAPAGFGTAGVVTGQVDLLNDAAVIFASGQLTSIAAGSELTLDGANARVANSSNTSTNSALTGLTTISGSFDLRNGATASVSGSLDIGAGGALVLDRFGGSGGAHLTVAGTLTNSNLLIGNTGLSAADDVTAAGLVNTGRILVQGSAANQATLNVAAPAGFGTAGVVTGQVDLLNDAAVIFASGQLTSIAAGSELTLDGANARVANSSNTSTNSALTGLTTISGSFDLRNGATASVSGSLDIGAGGALVLDRFGGSGGAHLTVAGTLTNSNLLIGNTGLSAADDVTAAGLVNTGRILVQGSAANQATLNVAAPAGFGTAGVVTGQVDLLNDAAVIFASGQLTSIAAGSELTLDGANARVANSSNTSTNSALTGLTTISGSFDLRNGATASVSGSLDIGAGGALVLDRFGGSGGAHLTVAGTLTNSNLLIGNTGLSAADDVTADGLVNTGRILVQGSAANQATLNVAAPAGFGTAGVVTGQVDLLNDAAVIFASGQLTSIAAGSELTLDGANARVANSSNTSTNSALTGLTTISGSFDLRNGATASVSGSLDIGAGGALVLDRFGGSGGAHLTVAGTLTNSNLLIGNTGLSAADDVTAAGLVNTGRILVQGSAANQATLNVAAPAGFGTAGVVTGQVDLLNDAAVIFASGQLTSIAAGSELTLDGANARVANSSNTSTNSALTGLTTISGSFDLRNGATASVSGSLDIGAGGALVLDRFGGSGGAHLTVAGTLTNSSLLQVGNSSLSASDDLAAASLTNSGTINLAGSGTNQAALALSGSAANSGNVNIGGAANVILSGPNSYTQTAGTTLVNGMLSATTVALGGGLLDGLGTVAGDLNNTGGTILVASGNNTGNLTISGDYLEGVGGVLEMVVKGTAAGQYSTLAINNGSANLQGGTLQIDVTNFTLDAGQTYDLVTFASGQLTGTFGSIRSGAFSANGSSLNVANGLTLHVIYDNPGGRIQLQVVNSPVVDHWTDGTGNWTELAKWDAGVPTANSDVVIGTTANGNVFLDVNGAAHTLTVDAGNRLELGGNRTLAVTETAAI